MSKFQDEEFKMQYEVSSWMRNFGIDDDDTFNAGEVEQALESYSYDATQKLKGLFTSEIDSLIQEIKQETVSVNQSTYAIKVLERLKEKL